MPIPSRSFRLENANLHLDCFSRFAALAPLLKNLRLRMVTKNGSFIIRVECCDACHTYIKSIDLTKNGLAVPLVDELASIPLDLWAVEHGYEKLHPNLFGM